ncbi:MAG: hypothetical protein ACLR23_21300 [Clostridia bacterium]
MPAEKRHEKCTPARRATAVASGHTQPNSPPLPVERRPCRRRNRMKMHAGSRNGCGQRAHAAKSLAATVKTTMPAEKQDEKCTPARRAATRTSGHTQPVPRHHLSRRPCPAEKRHEKCTPVSARNSSGPAGTRSQTSRRYRQDDHAGGETG